MFLRSIQKVLDQWREAPNCKPMVLRGARQVGKTTAVHTFARQFDQYLYFNLELPREREVFQNFQDVDTLLPALFFLKNKTLGNLEQTLLFIDEIQEMPEVMSILRYFHEQVPGLAVVAAGSLLETLFNPQANFPVGRVTYRVVRPVSFPEFLAAIGENAALQQLQQIPLADFAHPKLLQLFHTYALLGGMPEVIQHYAQYRDLTALAPIYESLIAAYLDDVEKYATLPSQVQYIRHAIRSVFVEAGHRIKFQGFGQSNYGSREMSEALRTLEKALLIHLIFPQTKPTLPLAPDYRKSPRLQVLDSGLMNYALGIQKEIVKTEKLDQIYQGTLIEHLVGQELLASRSNVLSDLHFWVREKKTSQAEVDFLYPYNQQLIPVEVKSGAAGKLRSLHQFMDVAPHRTAVRFYSGSLTTSQVETPAGKSYRLLNLPYYLVSQLEEYLLWLDAT